MLNPSGLCQCGCGELAPLATLTKRRLGHVKGQAVRFINGHQMRFDHANHYAIDANGCWVWRGGRDRHGYGLRIKPDNGTAILPHRWFYEKHVGPIPAELHIDHLCRNRACVNPAHLEPVTPAVNQRRSSGTKLTAADVKAIREWVGPLRECAETFDISYQYAGVLRSRGECGRHWTDDLERDAA